MKTQTESKFFEPVIESYINGNISWVKEQVKKLSKENRKALYEYALSIDFGNAQSPENESKFFFNLI